MDTLLLLALLIIPAYILQTWLGFKQMKRFGEEFKTLRRNGKVAIGRQSGKLFSGVIVLLSIDDEGLILTGKKMQGTSVLAKFKDFESLNGQYLTEVDLTSDEVKSEFKNTRKAIEDAINNYQLVKHGKPIPEKKAPLSQLYDKVKNKVTI